MLDPDGDIVNTPVSPTKNGRIGVSFYVSAFHVSVFSPFWESVCDIVR